MIQNLFEKLSNLNFLTSELKIALTAKFEIIPKRSQVAKTFNSYFTSLTESLNLFRRLYLTNNVTNKILGIIDYLSNHPSILKRRT